MLLNRSRFSMAIKSKRRSQSLDVTATQTGVSKATLSRLERGHVPDVETFYKVCNWLAVPMEEFFKEGVNCYPCKVQTIPQAGEGT